MADNNNTMTSRDQNVIYESTPDGDIRTIVKDDPSNENSDNNGGIDSDLFQHHLRKSWDLDNDAAASAGDKDSGDGTTSSAPPPKHRHRRHKHNLSVQFLDISISEDITNNKGSGQTQNNSNAVQRKDPSSTSTTTTKMDVPIPPPPTNISADTDPSPTHTRTKSALEVEAAAAYYFDENDESSPTKDDDIANFQKNVHSSWESGDEEEDCTNKQHRSRGSFRGSFSKRRHRHNLSVQFTDDSLLGKDNDKGETMSNDIDDANAAFLKGTAQTPATSVSNREARAFDFGHDQTQQQQQQQQKPTPPAGIVVPVPIVVRPTTVNRKHRRVYSGRSNPAMAHRRVNTRGDSTPTKGEAWAPIPTAPMPPPHPSQLPPPPPPHHPTHPPHPASAHPYPSPYYPQGAPPPPPHPYGSAPTPPPYDPYYAATQPVDPRYYAPSPHHFNSSPSSDAGVPYDARASPMLYPTALGAGGQYPPSAQTSPGGYYAEQPPPHAANPYARQPSNLSQTSLDRGQQQELGEDFQVDKNSAVSDRSKENSNDGGNSGAHHHRKQSSLGSFLANSGFEDLFDDVDVGYDSAPDEQQSKRHAKSLSSASFMRSLSSDNFLKDHLQAVVEEKSNGSASPFASPKANSVPNSTADAYHQAYPGYYPYGPPRSASNWQDPNNYLRHSPIQAPPPSSQHRPLFGGGAIQTQFLPPSPPQQCVEVSTPNSAEGSGQDAHQKRQRRKCSVPDCTNRVVQGGLCISHGAKRKTCAHPGCEKNVKAKGLCSTHGPARKRCNAEGCTKVAVQGGRCIAHGAKKKVCSYAECTKQAILGGMCKKHHDETHGVVKVRGSRKPKSPASPRKEKPSHERGLSLFTDSAIVDTIISSGGLNEQNKGGL